MGGGAITQITSVNLVDNFLTGTPQITHFKAVYKRHTRFAIEAVEITGNSEPTQLVTSDQSITYPIPTNGDLLSRIWIEATLPADTSGSNTNYINWVNNTGAALLKESKVVIGGSGGSEIDKHDSLWYDLWNELTDHDGSDHIGLNKHLAKNSYLKSRNTLPQLHLNIPLQFWFNRNYGMALPLCAMKYSSVKIVNQYRKLPNLINSSNSTTTKFNLSIPEIKLFADYIYLDDDEKRRFAQNKHEYLIEVIDTEIVDFSKSVKFNFQLPVKELIWVIRANGREADKLGNAVDTTTASNSDATLNSSATEGGTTVTTTTVQGNDLFNYTCGDLTRGTAVTAATSGSGIFTSTAAEWFGTCKLQIQSGSNRFEPRKAVYFRTIQPRQAGHKIPSKHIYCYSFALNPEEGQYSGSCNFSLFDNSSLIFNEISGNDTDTNIHIYAVHYNVLRIVGGTAGLAYSA